LVIILITAMFLPILPSEKSKGGFKILGFKGTIRNQYSLLVDIPDSSSEIKSSALHKLLVQPVIDPKLTEKRLKEKSLSGVSAACVSWLLFASDVFYYQTSVQEEVNALAPSTVPAIWLLRLPTVGLLTLIWKDDDLSAFKEKVSSKCRKAGIVPAYRAN